MKVGRKLYLLYALCQEIRRKLVHGQVGEVCQEVDKAFGIPIQVKEVGQ